LPDGLSGILPVGLICRIRVAALAREARRQNHRRLLPGQSNVESESSRNLPLLKECQIQALR
jgi:hypothetical protein